MTHIEISTSMQFPFVFPKALVVVPACAFPSTDGSVDVESDSKLTSVDLDSESDLDNMQEFEPEQVTKKGGAKTINPRQLGVAFELPKRCEVPSLKGKGYWTTYPEWHIARVEGSAWAPEGFAATSDSPRTPPVHEWRHDRNAIGSHDFASTKHNFYSASLLDHDGCGLALSADADRHVRAWNAGNSIRLLAADFSHGGDTPLSYFHGPRCDAQIVQHHGTR